MISEKIKSLREKSKISAQDLNSKLSFEQGTIEEFEQGDKEPKIQEIIQLASFFQITSDELLGLNSDQETKEKESKSSEVDQKQKSDFNPLSLLGGLAMPGGFDLDNLQDDHSGDYEDDEDDELAMQLLEMTAAIDSRRKSKEG